MQQYTVLHERRIRYAWAVTWNGGKTICRADSIEDANRIADALNTINDIAKAEAKS